MSPSHRLPAPRDRLAGCIWLPRIIAKARLLLAGRLPADYAERFCHPTGVDGQFLSFFGLDRAALLAVADESDDAVAAWFAARPAASSARIAEWNELSVNLGRPGFPMANRLPIAKATSYKYLNTGEMETVFEVLEADEALVDGVARSAVGRAQNP
jgi:hypothetical protein